MIFCYLLFIGRVVLSSKMARLLNKLLEVTPSYANRTLTFMNIIALGIFRFSIDRGRPMAAKFYKYVKVEMRPPRVSELTPALEEGKSFIKFFQTGAWKQKTVKV